MNMKVLSVVTPPSIYQLSLGSQDSSKPQNTPQITKQLFFASTPRKLSFVVANEKGNDIKYK